MVRTKSDISNHAIRVFLQEVGKFYDDSRGFERFTSSRNQKLEILSFFYNRCCFCNTSINIKNMNQDHLIPMNKTSIGLHAWGNVAPCCQKCNSDKNRKNWMDYLRSISSSHQLKKREAKIKQFIKKYSYNPDIHIREIAENLYDDVGEVADVLINLRFKQAEKIIKNKSRAGAIK